MLTVHTGDGQCTKFDSVVQSDYLLIRQSIDDGARTFTVNNKHGLSCTFIVINVTRIIYEPVTPAKEA